MLLLMRTPERGMVSVERLAHSQSSPLAPRVRTMMEVRFGRNFGRVRLHTDDFSALSASAIGAQAYTYGRHIVFGRGCYNPETREGMWLLAHELAHVIQQGGKSSIRPVGIADADDSLERAADHAADLVAANCSLPRDFAYGTAPAGVIQRHVGPPCTGFGMEADPATILVAERTLELEYVTLPAIHGDVLLASNNFQPPNGYQVGGGFWPVFVDDMVNFLRQRPIQERPNIVNLHEHEVYFFRRQFRTDPALIGMIGLFHSSLDRLLRRHGMAPWDSIDSDWFPDHMLPFIGDPLKRFVCTQATDHIPPRGLILYDIRAPRRRRRPKRRAVQYELWTADTDMAQFLPHLKKGLPKAVPSYDPDNSNWVFIVPADFYYDWYKQTRSNKMWEFFSVKPSYDFPGGEAVKELRSRLHHVSLLLGVESLAIIVVGTIVFLAVAIAAAAAEAGAVATAGTAAGAGAGTAAVSLPTSATIIAPADIVAKFLAASGTAAATTAAGGGVTAAMWALAAAPAVKTVMAAAGVLLVIGTVNNAYAGTDQPDKPIVTKVSAFRAVAVDDFKPVGNTQAALSSGPPPDFSHTPETAKGKFNVGTKVLFDNAPHIIIGGFSVS